AVLVVGTMSIPGVLFPDLILGVFIRDTATLAIATLPLRIVALSLFIDCIGMVLMNALLGVGDMKRVTIISTSLQWLLFLPLVYVVGPLWGFGLWVVFSTQVAYRVLQSATFALMWKMGRWQAIKLS
ncbi:MAG: MATE family efflux transporter, partial [Myxococcota bacterium]